MTTPHGSLKAQPLLSLLTSLAETTRHATTRTALARRVTETLGRHLPLIELTLGWLEPHSNLDDASAEIFQISNAMELEVVNTQRSSLAPQLVVALRTGAPLIQPHQRSGHLLSLPLLHNDGETGFVELHFDDTMSVDMLDDASLLEPLKQLLTSGQHTIRLIERVARVSRRAHRRSQQLKRELERYTWTDGIVANSASMRHILSQVELIAEHEANVSLFGESGTGKELLASTIHRLSRRADKPFIQVNCGAIPDGLVESELFGHEKGAFTGATRRHIGKIERAQGGTLLLDEVAELSPNAQVKLLRFLQERTFERVGGETSLKADVRVITATHRDLKAMVAAGEFRKDLYYRINVFPIFIPPLRQRRDDIPGLVAASLDAIAMRMHLPQPDVSTETMTRLCAHEWPGNVRELENTLERAMILSTGHDLILHDLLPAPVAAPNTSVGSAVVPLNTAIRHCIEAALTASGGKIYGADGAASLLELRPSTLQSKMKKLGIERQHYQFFDSGGS